VISLLRSGKVRSLLLFIWLFCFPNAVLWAQLKTWDGRYSIDQIEVTMVYFVPKDRQPIFDWKERLEYYAQRIEKFHEREFQGQSKLTVKVRPEVFESRYSTEQLRVGDANQIYFKTMEEVDKALEFGRATDKVFPILLVMSEINWRPLDDFFRVRPKDGKLEFEGNYNQGRHFPGAESGGARAVYWDNVGKGWGLVSADGWRVPYSGSDCVVYHEGVGHTIGLPHTDDANPSVMSLGQYYGWINESYVDPTQKRKLGWKPQEFEKDTLFSKFTAIPSPAVPKPNEKVQLQCTWPEKVALSSLTVEVQIRFGAPWVLVKEYVESELANTPELIDLGTFDRPSPVSYRVRVKAKDESQAELFGYFQVRESENQFPSPDAVISADLQNVAERENGLSGKAASSMSYRFEKEIDVLQQLPKDLVAVSGEWVWKDGLVESPKAYGARIELPVDVPEEYQMVYVVEPLDDPNGLTLGQQLDKNRFLVLLNYRIENSHLNAIENIDGQNVGNATTVDRALLVKNRISQVIVTVRKNGARVEVDGQPVIDWKGEGKDLSLSEYWDTPNKNRLFIGAYDCRYRIHRITLRALK